LKEHTMDALSLIKEVEAMVGGEYNITEDELTRTHVAAVHSKAKAEAL
jgi:transketolase